MYKAYVNAMSLSAWLINWYDSFFDRKNCLEPKSKERTRQWSWLLESAYKEEIRYVAEGNCNH